VFVCFDIDYGLGKLYGGAFLLSFTKTANLKLTHASASIISMHLMYMVELRDAFKLSREIIFTNYEWGKIPNIFNYQS